MNAYSGLFLVLIYLFGPVESKIEYGVTKDDGHGKSTPLALIRENKKLRLAEPERKTENYIEYPYDPVKGQEFVRACPNMDDIYDKTLYEKHDVYDYGKDLLCDRHIRPSYQKTKFSNCYDDIETKEGNQYEVGYLVKNEQTEEDEFQKIYNMCYSSTYGTLYTEHTIAYWDFLHLHVKPIEFPIILTELGIDWDEERKKNPNSQIYQLVSWFDLPINSWRISTLLNFNIVLLPWQEPAPLINAINRYVTEEPVSWVYMVDSYIRSGVMKMKSPVTVYTGSLTIAPDGIEPLKEKIRFNLNEGNDSNQIEKKDHTGKKTTKKLVTSVFKNIWKTITNPKDYYFIWKIIKHETKGAIAIITLVEPIKKCVQICDNIAVEANWVLFKSPQKGMCTYACEVDGVINSMFGLSHLGKIPTRLERIIDSTPSNNNHEDDNSTVENSIMDNTNPAEGDKEV